MVYPEAATRNLVVPESCVINRENCTSEAQTIKVPVVKKVAAGCIRNQHPYPPVKSLRDFKVVQELLMDLLRKRLEVVPENSGLPRIKIEVKLVEKVAVAELNERNGEREPT